MNNHTAQPSENSHFVHTSHWLEAGPEIDQELVRAYIPVEEEAELRGDY